MYIYRIDTHPVRTPGWCTYRAEASDLRDTSATAFTAASKKSAIRRQALSRRNTFEISALAVKKFCAIVKRNNRSGIVGVCRYASPRNNGAL